MRTNSHDEIVQKVVGSFPHYLRRTDHGFCRSTTRDKFGFGWTRMDLVREAFARVVVVDRTAETTIEEGLHWSLPAQPQLLFRFL